MLTPYSLTNRKLTVKVLCPTLLTFLLAGALRDKEAAATWFNFLLYSEVRLLTSFKDGGGPRPTKLILAGNPSIRFCSVTWRPERGASNSVYDSIDGSANRHCGRGDTSWTL